MQILFNYPQLLLLLLLLPLFILIYFIGIFYNRKKAVLFSNFAALQRISDAEIFSSNFISLSITLIILALMIFSVAGTMITFNADSSVFSHVLLIDSSSSMKAQDIAPNRLDAAKNAAKQFVDSLPLGVEVGVISFSGDSEVMQKLDTSKIKIKMAIDTITFRKVEGTNIYNALVAANQLLENRTMKSLLIISDGQLNVGEALDIINYSNKNNIVINTIAIGTEEGGITELNVTSKVNKDILKSFAFNTNGQFFEVNKTSDFDNIIGKINKPIFIDFSLYFVIGAIALFLINWVLYNFRFRTLP